MVDMSTNHTTTKNLAWSRIAPGFYRATTAAGTYEITRVNYDDGDWWVVEYPDRTIGDPTQYLATAKAWAAADDAEQAG